MLIYSKLVGYYYMQQISKNFFLTAMIFAVGILFFIACRIFNFYHIACASIFSILFFRIQKSRLSTVLSYYVLRFLHR